MHAVLKRSRGLTRCKGRPVLDVGGLPEGAVGAADVVVVAADDDRGADLAAGHRVVEGPRDRHAALLVGVEDPRLRTDHQLVLPRALQPAQVVLVLLHNLIRNTAWQR